MSPEPASPPRRGSGLLRATIGLLLSLAIVGAVLTAFGGTLFELSEGARLIVGLILAIVPAVLWLGLFYAQDRLEPEPHHYVVGLLILGALLGGAVEQPLLRNILQVQRWSESNIFTDLVANIFVHGLITAALVYAAVRFTVMPTSEFDELVDGIIYGTSVALGLGIAANLSYLFDNGTVSIGVGTMQVIVTSLAYATFGALVGYFLGLVKPGNAPGWYAGVGVFVTAVVHGLYLYVAGLFRTSTSGFSYNPWPSLISTTIFEVVVFAVVFYLIRGSVGRSAMVEKTP